MVSFELDNSLHNYSFFVCLIGQSSSQDQGSVKFKLSRDFGLAVIATSEDTQAVVTGRLPRECIKQLNWQNENEPSVSWIVKKSPLRVIVGDFKHSVSVKYTIRAEGGIAKFIISTIHDRYSVGLIEEDPAEGDDFNDDIFFPRIPVVNQTVFKMPATRLLNMLETVPKTVFDIEVKDNPAPHAKMSWTCDEGSVWVINIEQLEIVRNRHARIPYSAIPSLIQSLRYGCDARNEMKTMLTLMAEGLHIHFNIHRNEFNATSHHVIIHHFIPNPVHDVD